jgi:hypothetical protein
MVEFLLNNIKKVVRISQETHYVSATKPNRLMLFVETVTVYCENHTEHNRYALRTERSVSERTV